MFTLSFSWSTIAINNNASISDHFSVLFNLIISDPSFAPKVKLASAMRSFSYTKFEDDLSIKLNKIPLQQDPNTLLQHYELAVGSALDVQAPIKSRTMKCRLRHPWYNDSIHLARCDVLMKINGDQLS